MRRCAILFVLASIASLPVAKAGTPVRSEPAGRHVRATARGTLASLRLLPSLRGKNSSEPGEFLRAPGPSAPPHGYESTPASQGSAPATVATSTAPPLDPSFAGQIDDNSRLPPPDPTGSVGPTQVLTVTRRFVTVQDRSGGLLKTASVTNFWTPLAPNTVTYPRAAYDTLAGRWIVIAVADARTATSSILVAVSSSTDATGAWFEYRYDVSSNDTYWADFPALGFSRKWLVVTSNTYDNAGTFNHAMTLILDKADMYGHGVGRATVHDSAVDDGGNLIPAFTYDANQETMFLVQDYIGNIQVDTGDYRGYLLLYKIAGNVGAETWTWGPLIQGPPGMAWEDYPTDSNFAPQLGSNEKLDVDDSRFQSVVVRNGSIWAAHTIFLPVGGPTRSSVQWWELRTADSSIAQLGRIDDPSGSPSNRFFAYPSLAVNRYGDVGLGFSTFSTGEFPSAGYTFRFAGDPSGAMQAVRTLKAGEASFYKPQTNGVNRWGDYSAAAVDPVNDTDMWTLQQYASTPTGGTDRWGTWWGRIRNAQIAAVSPTTIAFGDQRTGTTSAARTVTVKNAGAHLLTTGAITQSGATASFPVSNQRCANTSLAPGVTCTFDVRFAPPTSDTLSSQISIATDDEQGAHVISLAGRGTIPRVALSASSFTYGAQKLGTTSSARVLTVTDPGTAPLVLGRLSFTGEAGSDFSLQTDACSNSTLAAGASCDVRVAFGPRFPGNRTAKLSIPSDAPSSPDSVSLIGDARGPWFSPSTRALDFGNSRVGVAAAQQTLTMSNAGNELLTLGTVSLSGSSASDFTVVADHCSNVSLAPSANCTMTFGFTPSTLGSRTATLSVPSNAVTSTDVISLLGAGIAPAIQVSPTTQSFGREHTGVRSPPRAVTVINAGTSPLTIGTVSLSSGAASEFAIASDTCSNRAIPAGAGCTIQATFMPLQEGTRTTTLRIPSDAASGPDHATLTGIGVVTQTTFDPWWLSFDAQSTKTTSPARTVVMKNIGTAAMHMGRIVKIGPNPTEFLVAGDTCSNVTVAPGGTCQLSIQFSPIGRGSRQATIQLPSDAPWSPDEVPLDGRGIMAVASPSATTFAFGDVRTLHSSDPQSLTLTNTGDAPLVVSSVAIDGAAPGDFVVRSTDCTSASIAPGAQCTVAVAFAPHSLGPKSARLVVTSNADAGPVAVALSGNGTGLPVAAVSPSSADLGFVAVGGEARRSFTLANVGQDPMAVFSIVETGSHDFSLDPHCPTSLDPGKGCIIDAIFRPSGDWQAQGAIEISTDAAQQPRITLSGRGDGVAPTSKFVTQSGAIVIAKAQVVEGSTADIGAGVDVVWLTFTPLVGAPTSVKPALDCAAGNLECSWHADAPLIPGLYTVVAKGYDAVGNAESPGPAISILAI